MKTVAKKDGSDYVINGTKMWISNSDIAGVFLVMANANPSAVSGLHLIQSNFKCSFLTLAQYNGKDAFYFLFEN